MEPAADPKAPLPAPPHPPPVDRTLASAVPIGVTTGCAVAALGALVGACFEPAAVTLLQRLAVQGLASAAGFTLALLVSLAVCHRAMWTAPALALAALLLAGTVWGADETLKYFAEKGVTPGAGIGVVIMAIFGLGAAVVVLVGGAIGLAITVTVTVLVARGLRDLHPGARRLASLLVVATAAVFAAVAGFLSGCHALAFVTCAVLL
ncbi:MAG: hypothetical protein ACLQVI_41170, partial [Polyangiaceae bacterium]